MKLTKNVISRDEAMKLAPDYVRYAEHEEGCWDILFDKIMPLFEKLKRGQKVLTYETLDEVYVVCKVSSINHNDIRAVDGPIVRVGNGEYTWRVDGDGYAYPLE